MRVDYGEGAGDSDVELEDESPQSRAVQELVEQFLEADEPKRELILGRFVAGLFDGSPELRLLSAMALCVVAPLAARAVKALTAALLEEPEVPADLWEGISEPAATSGSPQLFGVSEPALLVLMNVTTRALAVRALANIGPPADAALERLSELFDRPVFDTAPDGQPRLLGVSKAHLAEAIAAIGGPGYRDRLRASLRQTFVEAKGEVCDDLALIATIRAAGLLQDRELLCWLVDLDRSRDPEVRAAVATARLAIESDTDLISDGFGVRAIADLSREVFVDDADPVRRAAAINGLRLLGRHFPRLIPDGLVKALEAFTTHPFPILSDAATAALAELGVR